MSSTPLLRPAVWLPAVRVGTGADVFTVRLCEELKSRGVRAEIEWLPPRAEYLPWSVAVPRAPAWANVTHVNSWLPLQFWPKQMPVVVTVHHLVHDPCFRPFRSKLQAAYHELLIRRRELRSIQRAAAVSAVSDYVRGTAVTFTGREDIKAVYNWIDCTEFHPKPDGVRMAGVPFRLLMVVGTNSKRKGTDILSGFARALGEGFEIRRVGNRKAKAHPIEGVIDLGRVSKSELIREYRECDAVVSLSRYEGFGYTALEAMACGKPFLGFETSGLSEVVNADCGALVQVDDILALAAAARGVREKPEKAKRLGGHGRKRALTYFCRENANSYIQIYESLLGRVSTQVGI